MNKAHRWTFVVLVAAWSISCSAARGRCWSACSRARPPSDDLFRKPSSLVGGTSGRCICLDLDVILERLACLSVIVLLLAAVTGRAAVVSLDFETPGQYSDAFRPLYETGSTVPQQTTNDVANDFVQLDCGSSGSSAVSVYDITPGDGANTQSRFIVTSNALLTISADVRFTANNASFGFYLIDPETETNAYLAVFNINYSGGGSFDQFRFSNSTSPNTGGTQNLVNGSYGNNADVGVTTRSWIPVSLLYGLTSNNTPMLILTAGTQPSCITFTNTATVLTNFEVAVRLNTTSIGTNDFDNFVVATVTSPAVLYMAATDANASEIGLDPGRITITRTGAMGPLRIYYTVGGTASNGVDYSALSGLVDLSDGQTTADITIQPYEDYFIEGSETVKVTLTPGAGYVIASGPVTVTNEDDAAATIISDKAFFATLDLNQPALTAVKTAVQATNYPAARAAFAAYLRARMAPVFPMPPLTPNITTITNALQHRYTIVGIPYDFDPEPVTTINWSFNATTNPVNNEWTWQFNRHDWWDDLSQAYTNNPSVATNYLNELLFELNDWITTSPVPVAGWNSAVSRWRTIEAGIRMLGVWPRCFYQLKDSSRVSDDLLILWVKSFYEHAKFLEAHASTSGNYVAIEMHGLFTVGTLFQEFIEAAGWREFAVSRLGAMLTDSVYPDGAENELSPGYHDNVIGDVEGVKQLACTNNLQTSDVFDERLERLYNYELIVCEPNRRTPVINDSWNVNVAARLTSGFANFTNRTDFQWIATIGAKGTMPAFTSCLLPDAGQVVMRSDWDWTNNACYMLMDAGPYGTGGHQHEDKLSLNVDGYGTRHIIDCGRYDYDTSIYRTYCLGSHAHSQPLIDDLDQKRSGNAVLYTNRQSITWRTSALYDYAAGSYGNDSNEVWGVSRVRPAITTRHVFFAKPNLWVVIDDFKALDATSHTYSGLFHCSDDTLVTDAVQRITIQLLPGEFDPYARTTNTLAKPSLTITPLLAGGQTLHIIKGQESPVFGYQFEAGTTWKKQPIPSARYDRTVTGDTQMAYVLAAAPADNTPRTPTVTPAATAPDTYGVTVSFGNPSDEQTFLIGLNGETTTWQGMTYNTPALVVTASGIYDWEAPLPDEGPRFIGRWRSANPVACGYSHSLALRSDGSILAWGDNSFGQCDVPPPNSNFVAVSGGFFHSLGLKSDGSVAAWGRNNFGQCTLPSANSNFVAVAGGDDHSLGLKSDGSVVVWGDNSQNEYTVPSPNADFVAVSGGAEYSVGLKSDGHIVAWGRNDLHQCDMPLTNADFVAVAGGRYHVAGLKTNGSVVVWGDSRYGAFNVPPPNSNFVAVAGSCYHSLGVKPGGTVAAWGNTDYGQCDVPSPNSNFVAVAGGGFHSLGLKSEGTLVAWGLNTDGQCNIPELNAGFGQESGVVPDRGPVAGGTIVTVYGANLGDGSDVTNVTFCGIPAAAVLSQSPTRIVARIGAAQGPTNGDTVVYSSHYGPVARTNSFTYFVADPPAGPRFIGRWRTANPIAGGDQHSLALRSDGSILAWGNNDYGQCNVPSPNSGFVAVAAGANHSLGLKSDGSVAAWGLNDSVQCNVPLPNSNFVAVAASEFHSLGLKSDGTVVVWGQPYYTIPSPNSDFVAVATGFDHWLGLKSDGSVVAWGNNWCGQSDVPLPNSNFVAVAASEFHSLGLKSDGSVVAWGWDNDGQCSVPPPNSGFVAVAAGESHSLGLKSDGSVVAWGSDNDRQCTVPPPNSGFVAVAAGANHSLGLKSDGSVVVWGHNDYGNNPPNPNSGFGQEAGVVPPKGSVSGGTIVTVYGANLGDGSDVTKITFCGLPATILSQSPARIVARTGAAPGPTNGDVVVHSIHYGPVARTNSFTYFATCRITASSGQHGTISPDGGVEVPYGGSTNFVAEADTYYHIANLTTNGAEVAAAAGQRVYTSTWMNVTATGLLWASFAENLTANTGTPEWWLAQYGWTNNFMTAATNDIDHDGHAAWQEHIADTDPTNAASVFRIESLNFIPPEWRIYVQSSTGRIYTLWFTENLGENCWTNLSSQTGLSGSGGALPLVHTNGVGQGYYRVRVNLPQ